MAVLVLLAPYAMGQDVSAGITGKVTDPSAAPIPNAMVTAKDVDRGTISKTETSAEGIYNFSRLPVGRYEVRVEAAGFQTAVHSAFDLVLNQVAKVDLALTIGQVSTTMEITGAAPALQTQTTEVGTVMEAST